MAVIRGIHIIVFYLISAVDLPAQCSVFPKCHAVCLQVHVRPFQTAILQHLMIAQPVLKSDLCSCVSRCPAADPVLLDQNIGHVVLLQKIRGQDSGDAAPYDQDVCFCVAFQCRKRRTGDSFIPE